MGLYSENIDGDLSSTPISFKQKIEAITGISISVDPTEGETSIYLRDGVMEVTNRVKELSPADTFQFTKAFIGTSNTSIEKDAIGSIVHVTRESGTVNDWRACRFIGPDLKSRATDKSSIHYASKFNPAYTIDNKMIEIFPEPTSATAGNQCKIYAINKWPQNGRGAQLTVLHNEIGWFPQDKEFLVVLYTSIKVLDKLVNAAHSMPDNLTNIVLDIPSVPSLPSISANSISFSQAAPSYLPPSLTLPDVPTVNDLDIKAVPPTVPVLSDNSLTFTTKVPVYLQPVVSPDFADANTWLNTEEDSEMVASRMQIIGAQLQEYQADIQNSLNSFNENNAKYQIEFQRATQNAQLSSKDDDQKLQKYQAEVATYQADVSKQVQEYTQTFQKELGLWQANRTTLTQKYQTDLQNNLNIFNKENAQYQIEFQKSTQNAQLSSKDDDQAIQKYQAELASYSAQVNREVQEMSKLTAEVQNYSAQMQKIKIDVDIYHQRSMKLQQQYDAAFQFMVSPEKSQKAQQQRRQ